MYTYLIRYSEIFLKSEFVRRKWEKKLIENIKKVIDVKVKTNRGRIYLITDEQIDEKLKKIFGIVSFSRVVHCKLEELNDVVLKYCREKISNAKTFAVRVKRVGVHDFTSQQKAAELGSLILKEFPNLKVDLNNPEFELYVEIRDDNCYVFSEIVKGAGGIPLGVEGRVVSLFSAGIDSPVATYMMMKRGCEVLPIYFDLGGFFEGKAYERLKAVENVMKEYQPDFKVEVFNHEGFIKKAVEVLKEKNKLNYLCLICKRRMYRVAEEYAKEKKALGIVTGESLGQVASQTLDNLYILSKACSIPIYRPLIGMDKVEIEKIAKEIGTYKYSIIPVECKAKPKKPKTKGKLEVVEDLENEIYRIL